MKPRLLILCVICVGITLFSNSFAVAKLSGSSREKLEFMCTVLAEVMDSYDYNKDEKFSFQSYDKHLFSNTLLYYAVVGEGSTKPYLAKIIDEEYVITRGPVSSHIVIVP